MHHKEVSTYKPFTLSTTKVFTQIKRDVKAYRLNNKKQNQKETKGLYFWSSRYKYNLLFPIVSHCCGPLHQPPPHLYFVYIYI